MHLLRVFVTQVGGSMIMAAMDNSFSRLFEIYGARSIGISDTIGREGALVHGHGLR